MKNFSLSYRSILLISIASIILFFGASKAITYIHSLKIDWKVDDAKYLVTLYEEVLLQHETRASVEDTIIYLKDNQLTDEPMRFYTFDLDKFKQSASINNTASIAKLTVIPFIDDIYYKEIKSQKYGLPNITLINNEIIINNNINKKTIKVDTDNWFVTHIDDESLMLRSFKNEDGSHLVTFHEEIDVLHFPEQLEKDDMDTLKSLLRTNPNIKDKQARYLIINSNTVWDSELNVSENIDNADLLSSDGKSVLVKYEDSLHDFTFNVQSIEQYIEDSGKIRKVKLPEKAIIKKSTLNGVNFGELKLLSFTEERINFSSNIQSFYIGTAGTVKVSVDLTKKKPLYSILYIEEN